MFPAVKFSVRSGKASMMTEVIITWTGGPLKAEVEAVVEKYAHNREAYSEGIEQVTYISCVRKADKLEEAADWELALMQSIDIGWLFNDPANESITVFTPPYAPRQ